MWGCCEVALVVRRRDFFDLLDRMVLIETNTLLIDATMSSRTSRNKIVQPSNKRELPVGDVTETRERKYFVSCASSALLSVAWIGLCGFCAAVRIGTFLWNIFAAKPNQKKKRVVIGPYSSYLLRCVLEFLTVWFFSQWAVASPDATSQ